MSRQATVRALPLLGVASKDWIYQRFRKLVKNGVLFSHPIDITEGDGRPRPDEYKTSGRYTLYALDEKVMDVLTSPWRRPESTRGGMCGFFVFDGLTERVQVMP